MTGQSVYVKLTKEPIEIKNYVLSGENDAEPGFEFRGKVYLISDFLRCHENPWISDVFPEYIHGIETDAYYNPLYIGMNEGCDAVDVYEKINA